MQVRYLPIDGELVSEQWFVVLRDMRADGVDFNVNEGHRTMARQWYFWNLYQSGQGNLAAYPSANAPHIRTGRLDHAIDFGNDAAVFAWLARHGLRPARTVSGESWHIECPVDALVAYARAHGDPLKGLGPVRKKAASTLLARRRRRAVEARTGRGPRWKRAHHAVQRSHDRVEALQRRARPGRQKRLLAKVLADRDGVL